MGTAQKDVLSKSQEQGKRFHSNGHTHYKISCRQRLRAGLHGGEGPQVGAVTRLGGVPRLSIYSVIWAPHLSCKRNEIKMGDYMDGRVTPPKQAASPT